MSSLAVI